MQLGQMNQESEFANFLLDSKPANVVSMLPFPCADTVLGGVSQLPLLSSEQQQTFQTLLNQLDPTLM